MKVSDYLGIKVPFLKLLGVCAELNEKGHTVLSVDIRPELTNSFDMAHGGVVMTLLDVAMALAASGPVGQGGGAVTIDMSLSFLRPARGRIIAEARLLRGGRSLRFCEAEARDASGELVAKAIGTFKLHKEKSDASI